MRADILMRDWLYAAEWQARALAPATVRPPDAYREGTGRPVVVLPGVYETWHFMQPLMEALHGSGHPVHVVPTLRYNLRPIPDSAEQLRAVIEDQDLRDVVLLAHSKGGLIGKYAMTHLDDERRIASMTAIASPFAGSDWARFAPVRHLRIFRAADPVLSALARELEANARVTSIWGINDTLVPNGSELTGATNIPLPVSGHFRILGDPRTIGAVVRSIDGAAPGEPRTPT